MAVHLIDFNNDLLGMTVFKCYHFEQQQIIDHMHKVERNQEEHADFLLYMIKSQ